MGRPDHHFNVELAAAHGVDIAIFLHNIYYWMEYNRAYAQNYFDGRYWTFNSLSAFCEIHTYWSRRQIERIIATCKKAGLLLSGNYNSDRRDRTLWYTLSDEALAFFGEAPPCENEPEAPQTEEDDDTKTAECISPNREMQITERGNAFHQTGTALPNNKQTNNKQQDNNIPPISPTGERRTRRKREPRASPDWKPERFAGFWTFYPAEGRKAKQSAISAWDKLRPSDELITAIAKALVRLKATDEWQRGIGIPYAATFLNGARWEDAAELDAPEESAGGWAPDPEVL